MTKARRRTIQNPTWDNFSKLSPAKAAFLPDKNTSVRSSKALPKRAESENAKEDNLALAKKLQAIFDSVYDGLLVLNKDLTVIEINRSFLVRLGLRKDQVIGKKCFETLHGRSEPCNPKTCSVQPVFKNGKSYSLEKGFKSADGNFKYYEAQTTPVFDENGQIIQVVTAVRDFTDRINAEEALRDSEEKYRSIFENSSIGIFRTTVEGKVIAINPAMLRMLGYAPSDRPESIDNAGQIYSNPKDRMELLARVVKSAGVITIEKKLRRKNGTWFTALINIKAVHGSKGKILCIEGLFEDITQKKKAEEILLKREQELKAQAMHLEEAISAFKVLLKQREEDKKEFQEEILTNVKSLILPHVHAIKKSRLTPAQSHHLSLLESNINTIVSPFISRLSSRFLSLTPTEIQVANLIKEGKSTKEMADLLHLSQNTVIFHRYNLRSKLGIKNKKLNLGAYLQSLE